MFRPFLLLAMATAVLATVPVSAQDTFLLDARAGVQQAPTLNINGSETSAFRPMLQIHAAVQLVGPLYADGYFQLLGQPGHGNPSYGGGFGFELRQDLASLPIVLLGSAAIGVVELPTATDESQPRKRDAWSFNLGAGLGYRLERVGIEARFGHSWFRPRGSSSLDGRGMFGTLGFSIGI